jgi:hypothetical protein
VDGPHIWEADPAVREQHYQGALTYLHVAEVLGAKTIRIDAGGLYSPATQERVAVEAGAGEVSEDRVRLLEFQIGH